MSLSARASRMSPLLYQWPSELLPGRLVRRYERFQADVVLDTGQRVSAHCVNPGRMEGLVAPGLRVWLSRAKDTTRALPYTWELVELDGVLVGANTSLPNALVHRLLLAGCPGFSGEVTAERPMGRHHRVDFVLAGARLHYVEVKNCHLVYPDGRGYFPDSRSERATQHVEALRRQVRRGHRATVLFTVQRADCSAVRPSALHAPDFAQSLRRAARQGVELRALRFAPTLQGLHFDGEIPVEVEPYDVDLLSRWSAELEASSGWVRRDGKVAGRAPVSAGTRRAVRKRKGD